MDPAVGASTCASGNYVWSGNSGNLDRKSHEEGQEQPEFLFGCQHCPARRDRVCDVGIRKTIETGLLPVQEVQCEDCDKHQNGPGHGVKNELRRGVDTPFAAPHTDQEVHRYEHHFPEHVEQEEIRCREDTDHPGLEKQHEDEELLDPVGDRPRCQQAQRGQEGRQQDQEQADAVDPHAVADPERRNPGHVGDELEVGSGIVEMLEQMERKDERQQGHGQGEPPDHRPSVGTDENQH